MVSLPTCPAPKITPAGGWKVTERYNVPDLFPQAD